MKIELESPDYKSNNLVIPLFSGEVLDDSYKNNFQKKDLEVLELFLSKNPNLELYKNNFFILAYRRVSFSGG